MQRVAFVFLDMLHAKDGFVERAGVCDIGDGEDQVIQRLDPHAPSFDARRSSSERAKRVSGLIVDGA